MADVNATLEPVKGLFNKLLEKTIIGMFMASELMKSSSSVKC